MSASVTQVNDFSTGNDLRLVLIFGLLGRIDLQHKVGFRATPVVKQLRINKLSAPPIGRDVPGGWNIAISLERGNSVADNLMATLEQMYWSGQRLPTGQVYQYIREPDGSRSTFFFNPVTLHLSDAGNWRQEVTVQQTITGFSGTRRRL